MKLKQLEAKMLLTKFSLFKLSNNIRTMIIYLMSELHKRRELYHKQIRRQHLSAYFSSQRNKVLLEEIPNEEFITNFHNKILQIVTHLKNKQYQQALEIIHILCLSNSINHLNFFLDRFQVFTNFISKLTKNDYIDVETVLKDDLWQEIPKAYYTSMVWPFLKLLSTYHQPISPPAIINIIANLFANKNYINMNYSIQSHYQKQINYQNNYQNNYQKQTNQNKNHNYSLLTYILMVITNTLNEGNVGNLVDHFNIYQKLGLGNQLCNIITGSMKGQDFVRYKLLSVIEAYLRVQVWIKEEGERIGRKQDPVTIYLMGPQIAEKQNFLVFALSCLSLAEDGKLSSIKIIQNILSLYEYMASSIQPKQLIIICELMMHENRQIKFHSLSLVKDLVFYNTNISDELIKNNVLLEVLQRRLLFEEGTNDVYQDNSIEYIGCILSNCLLTTKQIRKMIEVHSIWQVVYNGINPSSKLMPLAIVFEYYFQQLSRDKIVDVFLGYLSAVRYLVERQSQNPIIKKIVQIIQKVYLKADNYWEKESEIIINAIEQNGLGWTIQLEDY